MRPLVGEKTGEATIVVRSCFPASECERFTHHDARLEAEHLVLQPGDRGAVLLHATLQLLQLARL